MSIRRFLTFVLASALAAAPLTAQANTNAPEFVDRVTLLSPQLVRSNGPVLRWTEFTNSMGGFLEYEVHRGTVAGFAPLADTKLTTIRDLGTLTWSDTTAAPGRTFYYRVRAISDDGLGPVSSAEQQVTTPAANRAKLTVQPGQATHVATDVTTPVGCLPWHNYGAASTTRVGVSSDGMVRRSLLKFDLRDVPVGATVSSATLTMHYAQLPAAVSTGQLDLHRLTRAWHEGTGNDAGTCNGSGANWPETRGGSHWTAAGGDLDTTKAGFIAAKARGVAGSDTVDLRSLVQKWVNGQAPNHGLLIKAASEGFPVSGDQSFGYHSDEPATGVQAPTLVVEYTDSSQANGPVVAITEPVPGATVSGSAVPVKAGVGDDSRVVKVEFLSNGTVFATDNTAPYATTMDTGPARYETRALTVRATDDAGNVTTSAPVSVSVDNGFPPYADLVSPPTQAAGTLTLTAAGNYVATKAVFLLDGESIGEVTGGYCWDNCSDRRFDLSWNTKHPLRTVANGSHTLVARLYEGERWSDSTPATITVQNDATDQYEVQVKLNDPVDTADDVVPLMVPENGTAGVPVQDPYSGTIDPATGLSGGSLNKSLATAPVASAPMAPAQTTTTCPVQAYCASVWIKNDSARNWDGTKVKLWYRWFADNGAVLYEAPSDTPLPAVFAAGQAQSLPVTIHPPKLPPGAELGAYHLRLDLYDADSRSWFGAMGRKPVDNPVVVAKNLEDRLGLERFWQYEAEDLGAGMSSLTNVANGNMLLRWSPFFAPGRGLGTTTDLTYNALEDHSRSPVGNNFSLSMSGLTRFGEPLDIHPNKADQIGGKSNKWVEFVDGDGTLHRFTGTTGTDGITRWAEPPGVNLYLRSVPANPPDRRWALARPDKVTFFFDEDGFPTAITDRNGNTISYLLENTPPGEDPGGPKKRIARVTDAGGRSFTIDYFSKDEAKKAHVRGKVQRILDHSGSALDLEYYDDGNLLRLVQRGGAKATGELLPDRSFVFTYTTSNGAGPAIPNPADRVNPAPKTPNQSTRIFSVRDPRGAETTYDYYGPSEGEHLRWKLQSRTNRLGNTTSFSYDLDQRVTTVAAPLSRTSSYTYDVDGKVTRIVNAKNEPALVEWSADFKVTKVTEPTGRFTTYSYNPNGYLASRTDQLGNRTELTYLEQQVDANDTGRHLSLLSTVTSPKGVATTTIPTDFQWRYAYDLTGNLDTTTDPSGAVTSYDYNGPGTANPGTVAAIRDANGNPPTTFPSYDPSGQPTEMVDPLGNRTRFGYDVDGMLRWAQDPNHAGDTGADERSYRSFFDYDAFHRLGRQSAPKSTRLDRGRLIWSSTDYDANDNITRRVDPHYGSASDSGTTGPASTATYDAMDQPTVVTNPDTSVDPQRERTAFGYDAAGRLVKQTKPKGVLSATVDDFTTVYGYDPLDRMTKQTVFGASTVEARHTHLCYDLAGDLRSVTSPRANLATVDCASTTTPFTARYDYDAAHRQTVRRDPAGHATRTGYDANNNVTSVETDIDVGRSTRDAMEYDQRDRPTVVRQRFDATRENLTRYEYDRNGNRSKMTPPRGLPTAYQYNGRNQMTRVDLPFEATETERQFVHRSYDGNGNLLWTSHPVTSANPADVRDTARTTMTYFDPGWVETSKDPRNPKVHFDYEPQGWQRTRVPEKKAAPGVLDETRRLTWEYFTDGQLRKRTDGEGQPSSYVYDANNNMLDATDASGVSDPDEKVMFTKASYTGFDEVAKSRHRREGEPVWKFSDYVYDPNGNITVRRENGEENDAGTQTKAPRRHELTYDQADWLTQQLDLGLDGACKDDRRIQNQFWSNGLERQRDIYRAGDGCVADPATWPRKQTTTWNHFDNGKLRTMVTRNGSDRVTESHDVGYFDDSGRYVNGHRTTDRFILERAEGNGATLCRGSTPCLTKYTYDARDRVIQHQKRENKVVSYRLDEPTKLIDDQTVRAGNVTTENNDRGESISRRYSADQLQDMSVGGATAKYWYDDSANLDCVTLATGNQGECNRSDGQSASPNVVSDYGYDHINRLTDIRQYSGGATPTDTSKYTYDAMDRTSKEVETHSGTENDRTTEFTYEGLSRRVTEEKQTGGSDPKTKQFSYDQFGHRIAMSDKSNTSGQEDHYSYSHDVQGSVSQLIGDAGQVKASYGYDAYGGSDAPSSDTQALTSGDTDKHKPLNPYRYSGRRYDSGAVPSSTPPVPAGTASYDMGARRYGPDMGRFLQQDQFGDALADLGLALDPLTQNRYSLVGGNPISFVEYDGHLGLLSDLGDSIKKAFETVRSRVSSMVSNLTGNNQGDGGNQGDTARRAVAQRATPKADDDQPNPAERIRDAFDKTLGEEGADLGDKIGNFTGALFGGAAWLGERGTKASAGLRQGLSGAAKEMSALRHNPVLQKIGRFARSPAGKWTGRGLNVLGFGLGFAKYYTQGDKALPSAAKAGIETAGGMAGAWGGAKVGAGIGTLIGGPGLGTAIGGAAGAVIGGIGGNWLASEGVERAEGWIDDKVGKAQDWAGEQVGNLADNLGLG